MSNEHPRWRAIETCDVNAAGTFVYGWGGDRIYHSPICRNRPMSRDDLSFFDAPDAARRQGFRACDDCCPDQAGWLVGASLWM